MGIIEAILKRLLAGKTPQYQHLRTFKDNGFKGMVLFAHFLMPFVNYEPTTQKLPMQKS